MVSLDERVVYMLLGCVIGYALGYFVRSRQEKKEQEVERRTRNDGGFVRFPLVADIALLAVIIVTVWSAFASQAASNNVENTQDSLSRITVCNQQYLAKTIDALNVRTKFTIAQVEANANLQRSQKDFLSVYLIVPPAPKAERLDSLRAYFNHVNNFVETSGDQVSVIRQHPYPTARELDQCLHPK